MTLYHRFDVVGEKPSYGKAIYAIDIIDFNLIRIGYTNTLWLGLDPEKLIKQGLEARISVIAIPQGLKDKVMTLNLEDNKAKIRGADKKGDSVAQEISEELKKQGKKFSVVYIGEYYSGYDEIYPELFEKPKIKD